jgi:hypothetical protein
MGWEVHFMQKISIIVCLSRNWQLQDDINIASTLCCLIMIFIKIEWKICKSAIKGLFMYLFSSLIFLSKNSPVLEMKIWIYWSESNSWIYFYIYLNINKNWKIYWSEQYSTGLGPEHRCSWWGLSTGLLYSDWQFLKRRLAIFCFQISKEKKLIIIFSTQKNAL